MKHSFLIVLLLLVQVAKFEAGNLDHLPPMTVEYGEAKNKINEII